MGFSLSLRERERVPKAGDGRTETRCLNGSRSKKRRALQTISALQPPRVPLIRPPATFSPRGGERETMSAMLAIHVQPPSVDADEAAALVQAHRAAATDAVAGDELDLGRLRPGDAVRFHRQPEPHGLLCAGGIQAEFVR